MRTKKKKFTFKKYPFVRRNNKRQVVVEDRIGQKKRRLLIAADEELWVDLWDRYADEDYIMGEIQPAYVHVALEFMAMEDLPKRRGNSKTKPWTLIDSIKIDSRYLYVFIDYWKSKPKDQWPLSFKRFLQRLNRKSVGASDELTLLAIKNVYGDVERTYKLKAFNNENNFFKTYIMGDKNSLNSIRKILLGSPDNEKPQGEIADLPLTDVILTRIFKTLRAEP